ncbi:hypothetical protein [Tardiphaga sp. 11_C7_N12_6]|uniref:hypothetical protein n=1 Tax=Tardiphaga sp. 11_C7_N12_6 TaxID=3240789 RepID=UPI003F2921CF
MRDAGRYIFKPAYDAHIEITRIFDFIQPTMIALWNLRWQVTGFFDAVPTATSDDLAMRFALGSEMRGGELKRACIDTPWEQQKSDFAEFVLITIIAAFEEYVEKIAHLASPSDPRKLRKSLQFPSANKSSNVAKLVKPSAALTGVFLASCRKNAKSSEASLNNLLVCYRFFKEMRNKLAHNGGRADIETVNSYNEFKIIGTTADLGLPEVPLHHPVAVGDKIALELRGVIGLSDVILRIITTYDTILSESMLAEQAILGRIVPVTKKDQLVKSNAKNRKISARIHNSGLPEAVLTPAFLAFLRREKIIPAFW